MQKREVIFPNLPTVISGVPKSVLRKVDVTHALWEVVCSRKTPNALGCQIALSNIMSTLDAAKVQQRRIIRAKKSFFKLTKVRRSSLTLFHDVHFYLICWARIAKLMQFLTKVAGFRRAKFVMKRYRTQLERMSCFRDHLEHFEERLPGGSRHHILKVPGDLFNIAGEFATIGGERINIGTESLRSLIIIVEAFKEAVLYDAIEVIEATDRSKVLDLIRDATIHQTIRYAQKALSISLKKI